MPAYMTELTERCGKSPSSRPQWPLIVCDKNNQSTKRKKKKERQFVQILIVLIFIRILLFLSAERIHLTEESA